jgi:hypothetical protein
MSMVGANVGINSQGLANHEQVNVRMKVANSRVKGMRHTSNHTEK